MIDQKRIVMYSGGVCSWAAAKRTVQEFGYRNLTLLFSDTIIEDEDTYRFLIESSGDLFGISNPEIGELAAKASQIPSVETGRLEERKSMLNYIRTRTTNIIQGLVWLCDGRTPWEVFRAEKFIGNSMVDPCSKLLKRNLMDKWRESHCDKGETINIFGLDWSERSRIEGDGKNKKGLRERLREKGWNSHFPMDSKPYMTKKEMIEWMNSLGIQEPRIYKLGFNHGNCGGFCIKAGLGQMQHLNQVMPKRFQWHADQETESIAQIGQTASPFLRDRKNGQDKRITMQEFKRRIDQQPRLFDDHGWGCGGGCAVDDPEDTGYSK